MRVPAVPAVVLHHVECSVGEEGGAGHGLVARVLLGEPELAQHHLTVAQQLIQTQFPAVAGRDDTFFVLYFMDSKLGEHTVAALETKHTQKRLECVCVCQKWLT